MVNGVRSCAERGMMVLVMLDSLRWMAIVVHVERPRGRGMRVSLSGRAKRRVLRCDGRQICDEGRVHRNMTVVCGGAALRNVAT